MAKTAAASQKKTTLIDNTAAPPSAGDLTKALRDRLTPEIVIGLVGPVASGVTTSGEILKEVISRSYGYEVHPIRMSSLIERNADLVGPPYTDGLPPAERIQKLQEVGSKLRERFGSSFLAAKAVELIAVERGKSGFEDEDLLEPKRVRRIHVIDSIKNPQEADLFRAVYGTAFWLVGVFAPKDLRKKRLEKNGSAPDIAEQIIARDEHEGPDHGQDVRETFFGSDYFLKNAGSSRDSLNKSVERLLSCIFEDSIVTPTPDERAIAYAKQAAAASACMSRQVGAVILNSEQSVIGQGWNEVPRPMGGLYSALDGDDDARCFKHGSKICHNDDRKEKLYKEISSEFKALLSSASIVSEIDATLADAGADPSLAEKLTQIIERETNSERIRSVLRNTGVKSLIEFSRSVHAEMAAIVDVARSGRGSMNGSTMYVTTFPCHNCARHIIASGVARVVYIEPYPKSLAIDLHEDAIHDLTFSENQASTGKRVRFEPFEGVGPARYFPVFLMGEERKEKGEYKVRHSQLKMPADAESLDAFTTLEKRVIEHLQKVEPQKGS